MKRPTVDDVLAAVGASGLDYRADPGSLSMWRVPTCPSCGGRRQAELEILERQNAAHLRCSAKQPCAEEDVLGALGLVEESTAKARLRVLDTRLLLTSTPEPVDWLVHGVVARGTVAMLAGREKQGKSLLCAAFGVGVATGGQTVGGIDCSAGRVLIVDAENGEANIHRRIQQLGLPLDAEDQLRFAEARGFDLRRDLAELDAVIGEFVPDLVVLDSMRSLWGGKENDSDEVAGCLDPLRELARRHNAGVVLIHHLSRAGAYRGSTAIGASVENILTLDRLEGDPLKARRRLRNDGCRFEEEQADRWLVVEVDRSLGALFVDAAEPFAAEPTEELAVAPVRHQLAEQILDLLQDGTRRRRARIATELSRDKKDGSVGNALRALEASGKIGRDEGHLYGLAHAVEPELHLAHDAWASGDELVKAILSDPELKAVELATTPPEHEG